MRPPYLLRLVSLLMCISASAVHASDGRQVPIVGFVALASRDHEQIAALEQGLIENGLVPGQTVRLEPRYSDGSREGMHQSIVELVDAGTRVFVAAGSNAARMVQEISKDAAVVVANLEVFESAGVTGTLSKPTGNATGFATLASELATKRLELLREIMPDLRKVVAVTHAMNSSHSVLLKLTAEAATRLQIEVLTVEVKSPEDVAPGLAAASAQGATAALFMRDYLFEAHRQILVDAARAAQLATSFDEAAFVPLGGLMSFAPDRPDLFRRSAGYVAKILAGTRPADLPIQQPTKFVLTINLRTAKALGLAVPPSVLIRADAVIE